MDIDFPAAHSMDTTWFAVDREGFVGYFHSHEAGAVPTVALHAEGEVEQISEQLSAILDADVSNDGFRIFDPAALLDHRGNAIHRNTSNHRFPLHETLMFLENESPLSGAIEEGLVIIEAATTGVATYWDTIDETTFSELHHRGLCLGCIRYWRTWYEQKSNWERRLYRFDHFDGYENWISGPYVRTSSPSAPLQVKDLPEPLRTALQEFEFPPSTFAECRRFQPIDGYDCATWESWFVSENETVVKGTPGRKHFLSSMTDDPDWIEWLENAGFRVERPKEAE
jgi:hypothetical protein